MTGPMLFLADQPRQTFHFSVAVLDDLLPRDDSDEGILIVYDRDKSLIDRAVQEILHIGGDMDRLVGSPAHDGHDGDILGLLQVIDRHSLDGPEKISLGNRTGILSVSAEDRNTGVFAMLHFFYRLTKAFVVIEKSNLILWSKEKKNIQDQLTSMPNSWAYRRTIPPSSASLRICSGQMDT